MDKLKNPIILSGIILGLFGMLGAGLVAITQMATAEQIKAVERAALLKNIYKLVPASSMDNDLLQDKITIHDPALSAKPVQVFRARKQGQPVAVVLSPVDAPGYAAQIRLIIAIKVDGSLGGVRVLGHKETPGLGDKIEESRSDWILSFANKSLTDPDRSKWKVKRDGGIFDQFTGATITPRSIVKKVKETLEYFAAHQQILFAETSVKQESDNE